MAWIIGLWCALCFLVMAADERVWADPMMLLGMAVFTVFVAGMLYQGYLWQWELAKAIANWSRRALKGNRAPD
ncbi:hypothetical protein [Brevundimonas basaltis]|uniref:Uncharacterized protein n=1 Tax=Brevundimonas basaltis TaxID=472166 RepID=A0A7W8MHN9_9CAUL|nr:hypothetical protein [Brevundimonas basaltis]